MTHQFSSWFKLKINCPWTASSKKIWNYRSHEHIKKERFCKLSVKCPKEGSKESTQWFESYMYRLRFKGKPLSSLLSSSVTQWWSNLCRTLDWPVFLTGTREKQIPSLFYPLELIVQSDWCYNIKNRIDVFSLQTTLFTANTVFTTSAVSVTPFFK